MEKLESSRWTRADHIIQRLDALGIAVDRKQIEADAGRVIGRMHIARELVRLGKSRTVQGAFEKYVGRGQPAYVPKWTVSCEYAIESIHTAGGLAVLAHPGLRSVKSILKKVLYFPFDGLEAYHVQHTPGQVANFLELAKDRGLLISGGSDCHGRVKGLKPEMGKVRVPFKHFAHLQDALAKQTSSPSLPR